MLDQGFTDMSSSTGLLFNRTRTIGMKFLNIVRATNFHTDAYGLIVHTNYCNTKITGTLQNDFMQTTNLSLFAFPCIEVLFPSLVNFFPLHRDIKYYLLDSHFMIIIHHLLECVPSCVWNLHRYIHILIITMIF